MRHARATGLQWIAGVLLFSATVSGQVPATTAQQRGAPPELEALAGLEGRWTVAVRESRGAGQPEFRYETTSVIERTMNGTALEERLEVDGTLFGVNRKVQVLALRTYDRFRGVYRIAYHDDASALLDIYEGALRNGRLAASNVRADTFFLTPKGNRSYTRITLHSLTPDRFELEIAGSADEGAIWTPAIHLVYSRVK